MKTLLLVAHGSRRAASNEEVRALAAQLAARETGCDAVRAAFLELAEPSIPDGLRAAVAEGADEVLVLPYFLSAGRHVAEDIPAEVDSVRAELAPAQIRIADYLGAAPALLELLAAQARDND